MLEKKLTLIRVE